MTITRQNITKKHSLYDMKRRQVNSAYATPNIYFHSRILHNISMNIQGTQIAASILSADFTRLGEDILAAQAAGIDRIHFDVMDMHYVPNLSFGPVVLQALNQLNLNIPVDIHLMTKPVDNLIKKFAELNPASICFHPEASPAIATSIKLIKSPTCLVGLAINPGTHINVLLPFINQLDYVLIMSVNPGFSGQSFIPQTFNKITDTYNLIKQYNPDCSIMVDGGVNMDNFADILQHGANSVVIGSAFFSAKNYNSYISRLKTLVI